MGDGPGQGDDGPVVAFVHIQKTAGTSLKFILQHSFGIAHCDVNPVDPTPGRPFGLEDLSLVRRIYPRLRSISGHEIIEPTRNLGTAVMPYTMLRDPVRRMMSHCQDKIVRGGSVDDIERYLADPEQHDFQVRKIAGAPDLDKARRLLSEHYFFVGLTERFESSMRLFEKVCPYPLDLRYQTRNEARDDSIRRRLEGESGLLDRIRKANRLDEALYRFVDEELLPAQIARAGGVTDAPLPRYAPGRPPPLRFVMSRLYHRGIYRSALKRERRRRGSA